MSDKDLSPDKARVDLQDDLERDPGISQSEGLFARQSPDDAAPTDGESTVGRQSDNDGGVAGAVSPGTGHDH